MSVLSGYAPAVETPGRRPRGLWRATLTGQVVGLLVLWVISFAFAFVPLAGLGSNFSIYLPWRIDGLWALAGAIGWCWLVTALIASVVRYSLWSKEIARPRVAWVQLSVGIAGYGALLLTRSDGGRLAIAVVGAPVLLGVLGYRRDGRVRAWPVRLDRWVAVLGVVALVVLAGSYSVPHAFVLDGGDSISAGGVDHVRLGKAMAINLQTNGVLPATDVQGVSIAGRGTAALRIRSARYALDYPGLPGRRSTPLPFKVPSRRSLWVTLNVALRSCPSTPVVIDRLDLSYRTLGIDTTMSVALKDPVRLACRR